MDFIKLIIIIFIFSITISFAEDCNGNEALKNDWFIDERVSVENTNYNNIIIYPNPFKNHLFIESKLFLIDEIIIINYLGEFVFKDQYNNSKNIFLNVNQLSLYNCYYLLILKSNNQTYYFPIIKN